MAMGKDMNQCRLQPEQIRCFTRCSKAGKVMPDGCACHVVVPACWFGIPRHNMTTETTAGKLSLLHAGAKR